MGLLYFAGTSCVMVMLLVTLLQLRQTDRYAGIHQASLRLARRCLVLMWLLLGAMLLSSLRDIWRAYPDWEGMMVPILETGMALFLGHFVRLLHRAYRNKVNLVAQFSDTVN